MEHLNGLFSSDDPITPTMHPTERLPPASIPAEMALLGALLHNNKVLDRVAFLEPHHFADPTNGRIFQEARRLIESKRVADAVTLKTLFEHTDALKEVGGTPYLVSLLSAMVGIINAGDYGKVVRETWQRRELIAIGEDLVNAAHGTDPIETPTEVALRCVAAIDEIAAGSGKDTAVSLDAAMDAAIAAMGAGRTPGIDTGFKCINRRIGGLEPGLVYVIAGRPGSGKSSLGHQIALSAARAGVGVLELSLEMSALQLGRRTLSSASKVPIFVMKQEHVSVDDAERIMRARHELKNLPLTIDDAGGQTPRMIAAKARAAKRKHGLGLVMVDHLNLTRPDAEDARHGPTYATGVAADVMLQIAKDNNVAVLELVQLNRGVETREDHRPNLADLRQSGSIEQNAYAVGFVYREELYVSGAPERNGDETDDRWQDRVTKWQEHKERVTGKADLIWQKIRDGELGTDPLLFDGKTTSFSELWGL